MINVGCFNLPKPTWKESLERHEMLRCCTVGFLQVQLPSKVSYEVIIYFYSLPAKDRRLSCQELILF